MTIMKKYWEFPKLPGSVTAWETSIMETVDPAINAGSSTRMILECNKEDVDRILDALNGEDLLVIAYMSGFHDGKKLNFGE